MSEGEFRCGGIDIDANHVVGMTSAEFGGDGSRAGADLKDPIPWYCAGDSEHTMPDGFCPASLYLIALVNQL